MARKITSAITTAAIVITQLGAPVVVQAQTEPVPLPAPVPEQAPQRGYPYPDYINNRDDFAGRISCESRNGRYERCNVRTDNRVVLLTRSGRCTEGRTWGYDQRSIWVSDGCSGTFGYGYRQGGGGTYPPYPGDDSNEGFADKIKCESRDYRSERCRVRTDNRVRLIDRHGGTCDEGRSWGYDRRSIWVSDGCRATFAYGYGNYRPDKDKGPSTGAIIGGVAVAAGLIALLSSKGKKKDKPTDNSGGTTKPTTPTTPEPPTTYPPGPPAAVSADLAGVRADARPALQTCLFEAARQIGATGGTRLRFDRLTTIEPGIGGWRFAAALTATYPDGERATPIYCRATPSKVIQLDFTN